MWKISSNDVEHAKETIKESPAILQVGYHCHTDDAEGQLQPALPGHTDGDRDCSHSIFDILIKQRFQLR